MNEFAENSKDPSWKGKALRSRRALLYVPGSDRHKIEKAASLGADSVCLDLEDGVSLNRKAEARAIVVEALASLDFGKSERLVRINSIGSEFEAEDLVAILSSRLDGIIVPKVRDSQQVEWVSERVAKAEERNKREPASIRLILMIETARGIINLPEIAGADRRIDALVFGAEDYAADVGAIRTRDGREVLYARSSVVAAAAAFGLQAIDMLETDFKDLARLSMEAEEGAQMGFAGKQIIHPTQIGPVQEAFTPKKEEIANARRVVEAAMEASERGNGAFALDGKMVDQPIITSAERVLARARAAGLA